MAGGAAAAHLAELLQACIIRRARLPGRAIHGKVLVGGFTGDTFLHNRLVELYSICGSFSDAGRVFRSIPSKNAYSWNAAISAACRSGDLAGAWNLLEKMPERNAVSWNTVICATVRAGEEEKGLDLCGMMLEEGFVPTEFTLASAMSACGSLEKIGHGGAWHALAVRIGMEGDPLIENALIGMYSKCGGAGMAVRIFNGLRRPNEVAITAMMGGLVKDGSTEEALLLFSRMRKTGIHIDSVAVSCVLGACARSAAEERCIFGRLVHALVTKSGFDSDIHVGNSLVDFYVKSGDMGGAQNVFSSQHEWNNVSWNILIAGYGNQGDSEKVKHLLDQMQALGFKPDEVTRASQLSACAKSGDVDSARQVFDRMPSPSLASWNTILSIYSQREMHQEALELFKKMQQQQLSGVPFDRTTIAVALSACSGTGLLHFGKQIHGASTRRFLHGDLFVSSGLVDMYSKCGLIDLARQVFDRMPERDVVSWNSMISGLALHSCCGEAFRLFHQMLAAGFRPTEYSYASVISSCARLSSLSQGRQLHAQTLKDGLCNDVYVGSSMIDMYAKCGGVAEARFFFDHMPTRNIVSWNEMIHGYAQNGGGTAAVELFEEMLRRGGEVRPDGVTLIAVLTGCSNSGMVEKATELLHAMERDLDLVPLADHYACVVDALARAGRFREVKALIQKIPHVEDPIIWEVLLSACRVHGEAEMGRFAAERLFMLDPVNPSPYVLLSNIYAANGQWDQVAAVRRTMVDRGVAKDRGYSWIDDEVSVRAFMVDDEVRVVADRGG